MRLLCLPALAVPDGEKPIFGTAIRCPNSPAEESAAEKLADARPGLWGHPDPWRERTPQSFRAKRTCCCLQAADPRPAARLGRAEPDDGERGLSRSPRNDGRGACGAGLQQPVAGQGHPPVRTGDRTADFVASTALILTQHRGESIRRTMAYDYWRITANYSEL